MSRGATLRLGTAERMSLGLVALAVCLLLAADLAFGLFPDPASSAREWRQRFGRSLATQIAALVEAGDERTLGQTLQQVVVGDPELLSLAVRRRDGRLLASRGPHGEAWHVGATHTDQMRVPLYDGRSHWGDIELAFRPAQGYAWGWLRQPAVVAALFVGSVGFLLFWAYLRRAMQLLDPSRALPDRVRRAFDILADGVMVLDAQGRIVLVNRSLRALHPDAALGDVAGRLPSQLDWLRTALEATATPAPWERALQQAEPVSGVPLAIAQPQGPPLEAVIGCQPIVEGGGRPRGCIVTFHDVSALHQANAQLRAALAELEASREQIRAQNDDLRRLATRDPLTGCLNRRAFFDAAGDLLVAALRRNGELCCVMADIDHFKQFNDVYGHAVGDQVIQSVAKTLGAHLRQSDVLCRYGGEEFCIVLPNTTLEQAQEIAERMRQAVASSASAGVRGAQLRAISSSFGVATLASGATQLEPLIDQADKALYASKQAGRNRITCWEPALG